MTVKVDHHNVIKSKTIYASDAPMWDEDMLLYAILPTLAMLSRAVLTHRRVQVPLLGAPRVHRELGDDFEQVELVVWESGSRFAADRPIGKVTFTADELAKVPTEQREQWHPLRPATAEGTVSGTVDIEVTLAPPIRGKAELTVTGMSPRPINAAATA